MRKAKNTVQNNVRGSVAYRLLGIALVRRADGFNLDLHHEKKGNHDSCCFYIEGL